MRTQKHMVVHSLVKEHCWLPLLPLYIFEFKSTAAALAPCQPDQTETHHTASQGAGLVKAHNADVRCCLELQHAQHAYAFCFESCRASAVDPYDDCGDCDWHCCNKSAQHLHHNAAIGDLMSLEVWHSCAQEDAPVKGKCKATEAPYILQSPTLLSDTGKHKATRHFP